MEEVNLFNGNENDLLVLSADFRNRNNENNKIIYDLKKSLMFCYGIATALEDIEDVTFIGVLVDHLDKMVIKHLGLETPI